MWLAIDTSGDRAAVAVGDAAGPRAERSLVGARQHAGQLLPLIDRLLDEAGATPGALDGILLADGPGSFTGLRVGASVAKALAVARGLEVRTAPALQLLAAGALPPHRGPVLSVMDALRGDVYAAAYEVGPGVLTVVQPPTVVASTAAAALVPKGAGVVGTASEATLAALAHEVGGPRLALPASTAVALLELLGRPGALKPVADVATWEPVYGRPAEAQRKWEEAHGRPLSAPPPDAG